MIIETEILLRDLKLGHHLCPRHRAEERMKRVPWLKVYWSIPHLEQHVRSILPVEWLKVLVRRAGAVVPARDVVNIRSPDHDPSIRCERCGEHVCAIGVCAV